MSSNLPLISILIPVYNVEAFVQDAVLSICNQTYKNIEIIVVDDCSTDGTYNVVAELAQTDSRIKLFKNEKNSKIVKTLNFALQQATGDFIARMDGDDICSSDRLEKQLHFLLQNLEYDLVGSHVYTIDENDQIIGKQKMPTSAIKIEKIIKYISPVLHIWLAKRSVYETLEGYREIPGAEDYDFLLRMHSLNLKFTNLDSFDYSVRIRNGNTTSTIGFNQRLMSSYVVHLYNGRLKFGEDSFSHLGVEQYIQAHALDKKSFDESNVLLSLAFRAKSEKQFFKMVFLLIQSLVKSKYQFQYLYKRIMSKIILSG